ncbi:MAG: DUF2924 domain-containing protein [Micropepsaceae bacterium]
MPSPQKKKAPGKPGRNFVGLSAPLDASLAHLEKLGIEALRALWTKRFRSKLPPIASADILRRLIAWKMQVEAFGSFDEQTATRINALMRVVQRRKDNASAPLPGITLKAGTILVREWRGVEHRVLVLDKGFEHRDKRYRSLTHVARTISGTHWSGPRFFGLEAGQLKATLNSDGTP